MTYNHLHPQVLYFLDLLGLLLTQPHLQGRQQLLQRPTPFLDRRRVLREHPVRPRQQAPQLLCPTQSRRARKITSRQARC